jgi:hypothetical protein
LSYLEETVGPYQHDEDALLRALEALEASRAGWHADMREYARKRRRAKQRGQRTPHAHERNPNHFPRIWYGAPRPASLHALTHWRSHRLSALVATSDETANSLKTVVAAVLASDGHLAPEQRQVLDATIGELQQRVRSDLWHGDQAAYFRARDLLKVARLAEVAIRPAVPSCCGRTA